MIFSVKNRPIYTILVSFFSLKCSFLNGVTPLVLSWKPLKPWLVEEKLSGVDQEEAAEEAAVVNQ